MNKSAKERRASIRPPLGRFLLTLCGVLLVPALTSSGGKGPGAPLEPRRQDPVVMPTVERSHALRLSGAPRHEPGALLSASTFTLAEYSFDHQGLPDPQGWTAHDASARARTLKDVFLHVDDFAGLAGYAPLEGAQSMWCGVRPNDSTYVCRWATPPGYGNYWEQIFESVPFAAEGDVTLSYKIKWDMEPAILDITTVEYYDTAGQWERLPVNAGRYWYDHYGELTETFLIPAEAFNDSIRLCFGFFSDGAWSDEDGDWPTDGAYILDSLTVADTTGIIDFQDFESEPLGAQSTNDGDWSSRVFDLFGDYAGLFHGSNVLQEDSLVTNSTWLWGFFDGSPDDYGCAGHPEQAAVPLRRPSEGWGTVSIDNEIWSPVIDYTREVNGFAIPGSTIAAYLEFDVYRHLPPAEYVAYGYSVRSFVDGCPSAWSTPTYFWGDDRQWVREVFQIDDRIDSLATEIQVKLVCKDFCSPGLCADTTGLCHTQAPLFDNVKITKIVDPATGIGGPPGPANSLAQNVPNPFNPATTLRFAIEQEGHVTLRVYNVAGRLVRTLVDARLAPQAGGFEVRWDGTDGRGTRVASGIYFYRLTAGAFDRTRKMVLLK